jgi:hypothetical protein
MKISSVLHLKLDLLSIPEGGSPGDKSGEKMMNKLHMQ